MALNMKQQSKTSMPSSKQKMNYWTFSISYFTDFIIDLTASTRTCFWVDIDHFSLRDSLCTLLFPFENNVWIVSITTGNESFTWIIWMHYVDLHYFNFLHHLNLLIFKCSAPYTETKWWWMSAADSFFAVKICITLDILQSDMLVSVTFMIVRVVL